MKQACWLAIVLFGPSGFAQQPLKPSVRQMIELRATPTDCGSGNETLDDGRVRAEPIVIDIHPIPRKWPSFSRTSEPVGGLFELQQAAAGWTDANPERARAEGDADPYRREVLRAFSASDGRFDRDPPPRQFKQPALLIDDLATVCPSTADRALHFILLIDPDLEYPALAKKARVQGRMEFEAVIGKDGYVASARLVKGHPRLAPSAQALLVRYFRQPFATEVRVLIDIDFKRKIAKAN